MDKIYLLNPKERLPYFETAAAKMGVTVPLIEKDYWVVWVLGRLFNIDEIKSHLTFKGGTSLSKVYGLIRRFSEDIDLSIEKSFFGFSKDKSPDQAASRNKRTASLKRLSQECGKYVKGTLLKTLQEDFSTKLNSLDGWNLKIDETDPTGQTLLFDYPVVMTTRASYIQSSVKIEMGARAELPPRLSRHYYDFYQLINSPFKALALKNSKLLDRVAQHRDTYFHSGWANYLLAKQGTLKLTPPERIVNDLERDYQLMRDMFFEQTPIWNDMVNAIKLFEVEFNKG